MGLYINFPILLMQKTGKRTEKLSAKRPMEVMLMKNGEVFRGNCFPGNLYLLIWPNRLRRNQDMMWMTSCI